MAQKRVEKECFTDNGKRYIILDGKRRLLKEGESFRRSDNRFSYRITIDGTVFTKYAKTLDKLRIEEENIARDLADGINFSKAALTFNDWHKEVMKTKARKLKPSTLAGQNSIYRLYIENSVIGRMKLNDIRTQDLKKYYNNLIDESEHGLSYATIMQVHAVISYDLEIATQNDYIRRNYAHGAISDLPKEQKKMVPLTLEQIPLLLNFCEQSAVFSKHIPLLVFMLNTGVRISELAGMCWQDVDFEKRTIAIKRQLMYRRFADETQWKFHLQTPKSKSGVRTIVLLPGALQVLENLRKERQCKPVMVEGQALDLIFRTRTGGALTASKVNDVLYRLEKSYNEQAVEPLPHLSCHLLRHACITALARLGVDEKVRQSIAGHSTPIMTDHYTHTDEDITFQKQELQGIRICG